MEKFKLTNLLCEYRNNPLGISEPQPRFSWQMVSSVNGESQAAYRICVAEGAAALAKGDYLWDSGRITSGQCFGISYRGAALKPFTRYTWTVTVWDNCDESVTSEPQTFETGVFSLSDWSAKWVTAKPQGYGTSFFNLGDWQANTDSGAVHIRAEFDIKDKEVKSARLYSATTTGAFGNLTFCVNDVYLTLNGKKVGEDVVTPGQLSEKKWRALYRAYDITHRLTSGKNAFGAVILSMAYSAFIRVCYADGEKEDICLTDICKAAGKGPYTLWDEGVEDQGGKKEAYNALREYAGYDMPNFDDSEWSEPTFADIVSSIEEQVVTTVVTGSLKPVDIKQTGYIHYLVDFGQVINGHIKLTIRNPKKGRRISVCYGEAIHENGEINSFSTTNYQRGENGPHIDTYIPKGEEVEVFEPKFANHSFRYVDIINYPGEPAAYDIQAQIVNSPVMNKSEFSCSDEDINSLYAISYWSQRTNLASVPTDCPSRERHGWLGDALVVAESECINFNLITFYESWLKSIGDDMRSDGLINYITPFQSPLEDRLPDIPWAAAAVLIPWYSYEAYGDRRILEQSYPVLEKWIDYILTLKDSRRLIKGGILWNDHTAKMRMNTDWLGTLYCYICLVYMMKISVLLEKDGSRYTTLANEARETLRLEFKNEQGFADNLQSDLAHAVNLGLSERDEEQAALRLLTESLASSDYVLQCGCLGIWQLVAALEKHRRNDLIYKICKCDKPGSFLYWIKKYDATTAFEFLDYKDFYSRNHPFLMGSLTRWFFEGLAGIRKTAPGYKAFEIKPYLPEDMTFVNAKLDTNYGLISVKISKTDKGLKYDLSVPCGTTARLYLPGGEAMELESGKYSIDG
ncbi:MAG: family 78 glycoside hydrolase catalytic domain [Clostridia bacterium]|nr:family 78 glycoside hydrolase catalytic domain [Clostridia bacterium]